MDKIIACIDGSAYSKGVCTLSAWAAEQSGLPVTLLHVAAPHSEMAAQGDFSGQIGLGAKTSLLNELSKQDGDHGKLEQKKGQQMLAQAKDTLAAIGLAQPGTLHRRGALVDTLTELQSETALIVMGKCGEQHQTGPSGTGPDHPGSNVEPVSRSLGKPLLIASTTVDKPSNSFLFAYDASPSADKALAYLLSSQLLKGLDCYLLMAQSNADQAATALDKARTKLTDAGYTVRAALTSDKPVAEAVTASVAEHAATLLVIGAYGHAKLHNLIRRSKTTDLIRRSTVPVLLV